MDLRDFFFWFPHPVFLQMCNLVTFKWINIHVKEIDCHFPPSLLRTDRKNLS